MTCCHRQQPRAHYINVCASLNNEVVICIIHKTTAWTAGWHWCALSSKLAVRRTSTRVSMSPPPPPSYSYTPGKWGYKQMNVIGRVRAHTHHHTSTYKSASVSRRLWEAAVSSDGTLLKAARKSDQRRTRFEWGVGVILTWRRGDVYGWLLFMRHFISAVLLLNVTLWKLQMVQMVHFIWQFEIAWP